MVGQVVDFDLLDFEKKQEDFLREDSKVLVFGLLRLHRSDKEKHHYLVAGRGKPPNCLAPVECRKEQLDLLDVEVSLLEGRRRAFAEEV